MSKRESVTNIELGFPIGEFGGLGEFIEDTLRFPEYNLRSKTEVIECNVKDINKAKIENLIKGCVISSIRSCILEVVEGNMEFLKEGEDGIDISNEIIDGVESIVEDSINGAIDDLIDIGTKSELQKSNRDNAIFRIINQIRATIKTKFYVRIGDKIKSCVEDVIENCIGDRITTGQKGIGKKISAKINDDINGFIADGFEDGLDYCLGDGFENGLIFSEVDIDNDFTVYVSFDFDEELSYKKITRYVIYEQELLIDLCNLYISLKDKSSEEQGHEVINWCKHNFFPYNLRRIIEMKNYDGDELTEYLYYLNQSNLLQFKLEDFINDLRVLCKATMGLMAIVNIKSDKRDEAIEWLKDSKIYEPKEFLHEYDNDYAKMLMIHGFVNDSRRMQMGLQYNRESDKIVFAPFVNSVFDIAWNALIRIIAFSPSALTDEGKKFNAAFCEGCGKMFIKNSNRQKYCSEDACQKLRNCVKSANSYAKVGKERRKEKQKNEADSQP